MRVPIQNGNVSKRDSIEQLAENARTGKLKPSLRTISIASVPTREFLKQGCTKGCNKLGLGSKSRGILMS